MSVETLPSPVVDRIDDEPDLIHLFCCRPWRGLCGERLYGDSLGHDYPDGPDDCVVCVDLVDKACGFPGCRVWSGIRSWWRGRRSE